MERRGGRLTPARPPPPSVAGHTPVLRRPAQHPVRSRPLQAGPRPDEHGEEAGRGSQPRLRAAPQVR